jgi:hypothetical protein
MLRGIQQGGSMRAAPSPIATVVKFLLIVAVSLGVPAAAAAQGAGVRAGVSIDPDQFYFGGHYETDALVDRVHFAPTSKSASETT